MTEHLLSPLAASAEDAHRAPRHSMPIAEAIGFATLFWILALLPLPSLAQGDGDSRPLLVAVMDAPPFYEKQEDGRWEGMGIDIWQAVARDQDWEYELREYDSLASMIQAVQAGDVDITPAIAAARRFEDVMDLSHSYYRSGSGIAVATARGGPRWFGVFALLASPGFLSLIGVLLLVWLTMGAVVWMFERRENREMFGDSALKGLGNGIWWAAVTMTTVGYGDKAPRTLGGRTVAILWMLASVALVSSFTAAITASHTIDELSGKIRGLADLREVRVGSTFGSEPVRFLAERGLAVQPFAHERDGLKAVADGTLDAFVYNELILRQLAKTEFAGQVRVLTATFNHYAVKMALPTGSALREPLNRSLLHVINDSGWSRQIERYTGSDH